MASRDSNMNHGKFADLKVATAETSPQQPCLTLDLRLNGRSNPGHIQQIRSYMATSNSPAQEHYWLELGGSTSIPCLFFPGMITMKWVTSNKMWEYMYKPAGQ